VALNTDKLDKAVARFKAACGDHKKLYDYGQFYVTYRTRDDLLEQIKTELNAKLRISTDDLKDDIEFFEGKLAWPPVYVDLPGIMGKLSNIERNGDMAAIRAMFTASEADRANAQSDFNALWSRKEFPEYPLWAGIASLQKEQGAWKIEKDRCWQVLRSFAGMHLKKNNVSSLPAPVQISMSLLAGARLEDVSPKRQEVIYQSGPGLATAVARMKDVIDANGYVHCGVLSGLTHDQSKFPQPEHHILAFAYDSVEGQNAFLFWDPDAFATEIKSLSWGRGFGLLFSRAGRLCTGIDDADLADLDEFGGHTREPHRHCYQVYTLQSLPMITTVKLHTKVMSTPTGSSVDDMLDKAVWLYAAHDIEIHEASRELIDPGSDLDRYQTLFIGDGDTGPSDQVTALQTAVRDRREEFGVDPPEDEAVVVFVDDLVPTARGSALSPQGKPGIVLSAASAGDWTLAHEIGRLAGLEVAAEAGRLMSASTAGLDDPDLTDEEAQAVIDSPLAEA
jgi:hypothetical protein